MTQESIVLSTAPPFPGADAVAAINKANQALASDFAGSIDPAALAGPYVTWADTGNMLLKRRNAAGAAWVVEDYLLMSLEDRRWASLPVGHIEPIRDDIAGIPIPSMNNQHFRYVKLTAGDAYNAGVLTGESVSGSSPLITATAVVSLVDSPINGRTINLINTDSRFLRASAASGSLQDDAIQNIVGVLSPSGSVTTQAGTGPFRMQGPNVGSAQSGPGAQIPSVLSFDASRAVRTGNETRARNIGVTYYMRIK